jgi:hypothetical protein
MIGMYFHHPWFLAALPLALAPAVFHLLALRRSVTVRFAWTHLVRRALHHSSARRKLVDIAVLVMRCLLIAVCLLYFARPVGHVDPAVRGRVRLTLAVDTSFSMRRRGSEQPVFQQCLERADRLLQFLEPAGMQVDVVSFNTSVRRETPGPVGSAQARAAVAALVPGWSGTDLGALFQWWVGRAAAQDRETGGRLHHKLLVLTDRAVHGIRDIVAVSSPAATGHQDVLLWHPAFGGPNGRIRDVTFDAVENGVVSVRCNPADVAVGGQALLSTDGRVVDALIVDGMRDSYAFAWNPRLPRGDTPLEVRLPDDILSEDNVFRCVYRGASRRRLLCRIEEPFDVRGVDSVRFYLDRLEGAGWEVTWAPGGTGPVAPPWTLELRAGLRAMPADDTASGRPLLVFPAADVDVPSYERFTEGVEFIEPRAAVREPFRLVYGQDEAFNGFCAQYDLRNIEVYRTWRMTITGSASGWRPVLYFNDGTPALAVRGTTWVSAFPLDRTSTNLALKPFFIGLLGYIAAHAAPARTLGAYEIVGMPVPLNDYPRIVVHPEGVPVSPDTVSVSPEGVRFLKPGWYQISGDGGSQVIAVNPDPAEGDLTLATPEHVRRVLRAAGAIGSMSAIGMEREGDLHEAVAWCLGREYAGLLAMLMALLFAVETALSRLGGRLV